VNALISTIFAQTTSEAVKDTYKQVIKSLRASFPEIAQMLVEAEPDLTAFAAFPREHWQKIWTGNPIERLNRETGRRTDVVQDSCPTGTPSPDWSVRSYRSSTRNGSTANAATYPKPHYAASHGSSTNKPKPPTPSWPSPHNQIYTTPRDLTLRAEVGRCYVPRSVDLTF